MTQNTAKLRKPMESPLLAILKPPPHITKRCGAHARTTGLPCQKWACIGSARCRNHGGATGSGRPATTGKHTAEAKRNRNFLATAEAILSTYCKKPPPIEVWPAGLEGGAVTSGA